MSNTLSIEILVSWLLMLIFIVFGILNWIQIDPRPGIFYLVLSLFYFPPFWPIAQRLVGFRIPFWIRILIAIFVLWGSLAVGDLAELYGL